MHRTSGRNLLKLAIGILMSWIVCYLSHTAISPVSRREHNLAFAAWITGLVLLMLGGKTEEKIVALHLLVLWQPLWQLISEHALVVFLIANLPT